MAQRDCSSRATGAKVALSSWARASPAVAACADASRMTSLVVLRTLVDPVTGHLHLGAGELRAGKRHLGAAAPGRSEAEAAGAAPPGPLDGALRPGDLVDEVARTAAPRLDSLQPRRLAARDVHERAVRLVGLEAHGGPEGGVVVTPGAGAVVARDDRLHVVPEAHRRPRLRERREAQAGAPVGAA